jgi:hypothetical protein
MPSIKNAFVNVEQDVVETGHEFTKKTFYGFSIDGTEDHDSVVISQDGQQIKMSATQAVELMNAINFMIIW